MALTESTRQSNVCYFAYSVDVPTYEIYRMFSGQQSSEFSYFSLRKHPNVIIAADKEGISVLEYKIDTRMSIKI